MITIEAFAFAGFDDIPVFIHPCGTVIDLDRDRDPETAAQIDAGECDCENTAPWLRIYVARES